MDGVKLKDLSAYEQTELRNKVDGDYAGCGIIKTGQYYVLAYKPEKDPKTYRCTGVILFAKDITSGTKNTISIPEVVVPFKTGFLVSLEYGQQPFKTRLEQATRKMLAAIEQNEKTMNDEIALMERAKADREAAIKNHTEKIRACQLKIDSTMKTIIPDSRPMIEIAMEKHMLEAAKEIPSDVIFSASESVFEVATAGEKTAREKMYSSEKPYKSELERQTAFNNDFLYTYRNRVNTTPEEDKRKFTADEIVRMSGKNAFAPDDIVRMIVNKPEDPVVMDAELLSPRDPRYLTELEKNQAEPVEIISVETVSDS